MRRHGDNGKPDGKLISASEIACYAYCPEQWRLEYGLGLADDNQASRLAGTRHHDWKVLAERIAGGSILLGRILAVAAFLGLLLLLWWRR